MTEERDEEPKPTKSTRGRMISEIAIRVPAVFAGFFLAAPVALLVAPGHYDPVRQLYISQETGQPAFVDTSTEGSGVRLAGDTTGSRCSITTMTGIRDRTPPDDHPDTVQDDLD